MRDVCAECARNCLLVHSQKNSLSNVPSSFFKVMIGSDFSRVLYLPPKFGPTASALVDKKAIIEDSSGQQWKVIVSIVNKSFALQEGWNAFSMEHGLVVGDFLVFNYIGSSHFVVKIYDKSGCEKFDFSKKRKQKKRSRSRTDLDARDDMLNRQRSDASVVNLSDVEKTQSQQKDVDVDGTENNEENTSKNNNNKGRAQSLCKAKHCEDPYYMTDRDFGDKEREYRSPLFDVFSNEILNNSGADGTGKFTTRNAIVDASIYNKDPLLEEILGRKATQDPSEFELTGRNQFLEEVDERAYVCDRHYCVDETPEHFLITYAMQLEETRQNNSTMSNREVQKYQFAEVSETDPVVISKERQRLIGNCQNSQQMINESLDAPIHHGEMKRMVKKELLDMTPYVCSYNDQFLSTRFSKVVLGEVAQSSQTTIKDHGSFLNSVKAEPIHYGAANVPAFVSQMKGKDGENDGAPSGSTEDTVADPLP